MYFPFDKINLWGSYNFFTDYLRIDSFKYKNESFIKLLLKLDRDKDLTGKNRILYFLPFLF